MMFLISFFSVLLFFLCHFVLLLCRKQMNLWAQGDTLRSKQQKLQVYEESNVPHLISSMDDLTISSSLLKSGSMEEVRSVKYSSMHSFIK